MFGNALGSAGTVGVLSSSCDCRRCMWSTNSRHCAAQVIRNLESLIESKDDIGYMAITRPLGFKKMYLQSVCWMPAVSCAGAGGVPTSVRAK